MTRHPFHTLDAVPFRWLFGLSAASSMVAWAVLIWIGQPLKLPPDGGSWRIRDGIVAFEFAGDPANAQKIIERWHGKLAVRAGFSIGFDYLFIVTYVLAISCGCIWGADVLRARFARLASFGCAMAWTVLLAGILDGIENAALLRQLLASAASPWPEIAYWCAAVKFTLVILGLAYMLVAALECGRNRLAPTGSEAEDSE